MRKEDDIASTVHHYLSGRLRLYSRYGIVMLIICSLAYPLTAQVKPEHKKVYTVSEDGTLYWQSELPMFIFISDNPDAKNAHLLQSESTPEYVDPMYLDTEGVNYFRTSYAVDSIGKVVEPKVELLWEVFKDSQSPLTSVKFDNAVEYTSEEGDVYYGPGLTTSATSIDQNSGVNYILYSLDDGDYQKYKNEITYSDDRAYDLKVYAIDKVGNEEELHQHTFIHDIKAPVSEYQVLGDRSGNVLSPRSTISLSSIDYSSGLKDVYYEMDGSASRVYTSEIKLNQLSDGEHIITFFGKDNVENKEVSKEFKFYLDAKPPEVEATVLGDQYQNRGRVFISTRTKVQLKAMDNKAGVKKLIYSIDGGPEKIYREPFILDKSKGSHVVKYYAVDKVNNDYKGLFMEEYGGRKALDMDMDAPEISHSYTGSQYFSRDTTFITSATRIVLNADDIESGVKAMGYKINGAKGVDYAAPITLQDEGLYVIDFYGTDEVNNRNTKDFFFVVDNTGPKLEYIISMEPVGHIVLNDKDAPIPVYSKGTKLYLGATDAVVDTEDIYFSINGGEEIVYAKPYRFKEPGLVSFSIRAIDKLGNETRSETIELFIK